MGASNKPDCVLPATGPVGTVTPIGSHFNSGANSRTMATTTHSVDKYLADKKASGRIGRTSEMKQRRILYGFAAHCPQDPSRIRQRDVLRWMRTIRHLAAGTRHGYHATARGFTGWLLRRGVLKKDPFADVPSPRVPQPIHRALDGQQVARLVAACETRREWVLVLLALHTGLRRAELAALEVGDVSLIAKTVSVREGKGGHSRLVPLSEEACRVVADYIAAEGLHAGPLLRSEVNPERGVGPQTVWRDFVRVARRAGVKLRAYDGVATHAARHTCATDTHRATGDVLVVQAILGHAHVSSTQRYVAALDIERLRPGVAGRSYLGGAA